MDHRFFIGAVILTLLVCGSCLEPLDWTDDIEPTNTIVVEGLITTEAGPHVVYLRRTQDVIAEGPGPGVEGAEVFIGDGESEFQLDEIAPGIYQTDSTIRGEVGKTYDLRIEFDGEVYSATANMIEAEPLEMLEVRPWAGDPNNSDGFQYFEFTYRSNFGVPAPYNYSVNLRLPDNVKDYYPENWDIPQWITCVLSSEDNVLRDSTYYLHPGLEPPALFADGESTYAGFTYGTVVTEKFYSMTPLHYTFIRAVMSESDWKGLGPFGYLPANVPTNISNGALGWFAASDVVVIRQIVE